MEGWEKDGWELLVRRSAVPFRFCSSIMVLRFAGKSTVGEPNNGVSFGTEDREREKERKKE